ncbi:MAG: sensor histidine kinase, partial [Burkholderiales bacterium]
SRLEAGQLQPMREWLTLLDILRDRAEAFGTQAEADDKRITASAPADLPLVLADPTLVSRVLDNLISNALKYTERGGRVRLSAEMNQQAVIVRVQDDGEGVPPEHAERIFDKFAQVLNANGAPLRQGAGLGLTFCKLAVEAHGGRIWVESAPGQGSTFLFTLPVL